MSRDPVRRARVERDKGRRGWDYDSERSVLSPRLRFKSGSMRLIGLA